MLSFIALRKCVSPIESSLSIVLVLFLHEAFRKCVSPIESSLSIVLVLFLHEAFINTG